MIILSSNLLKNNKTLMSLTLQIKIKSSFWFLFFGFLILLQQRDDICIIVVVNYIYFLILGLLILGGRFLCNNVNNKKT